MKIQSNADFTQSQALNIVLHKLSGAPSSPVSGQVYYNTGSNLLFVWNGSAWRPTDAAGLTDGSIANTALTTNPLARANHTGTQLANTISNLATTVQAYTLDQFGAPAADLSVNSHKLTNLLAGVSGTDAVNLTQVNSLIAAAVSGQTAIKNPARAYAASNITLSGTQTIDGVSVVAGDRVLVGNQTTASQNNLYVVASGAWTVATDATPANQWLEGTEILIAEGSVYGGSIFRQATASPTLTTLTFIQTAKINTYTADGTTLTLTGTQFAVNYGVGLTLTSSKLAVDYTTVSRAVSGTITHDGTTTSFPITHSLGKPVIAQVFDSGGNLIIVDTVRTNTNTTTFNWGAAQTNGTTFNYTIVG